MTGSKLESPTFSIKDVIYLIAIFAGYMVQRYDLQVMIHDEITTRSADVRIIESRLNALEAKKTSSGPAKQNNENIFYAEAVLPSYSKSKLKKIKYKPL